MSSLLDTTRAHQLQIPSSPIYSKSSHSIAIHDPDTTPSSPPEKILPVPLSHHGHSLILPPATDFDAIHKSTRDTSARSHRDSSGRSASSSGNGNPWGSCKGLDNDALRSLQEYCSSFDQVRLLKRGLQTLT